MDQPGRIEIYGRDDCRFSAAAVALCVRKNLHHAYHDLGEALVEEELKERAPGAIVTPQIFLGPHTIGSLGDLEIKIKDGTIESIIGGY